MSNWSGMTVGKQLELIREDLDLEREFGRPSLQDNVIGPKTVAPKGSHLKVVGEDDEVREAPYERGVPAPACVRKFF